MAGEKENAAEAKTDGDEAGSAAPKSGKGGAIVNAAGIFVLSLVAVIVGGFVNAKLHPQADQEYVLDPKDNHIKVYVPPEPKKKEDKKEAAQKKPHGPALFYTLDPPLVVNFEEASSVRFLQIGIDVMARDPVVIEEVTKHAPMIRNNLLLLISNRDYKALMTREGKEQLRSEALAEVKKIMKKETGQSDIEDLLFTSFVVQ